MGRACQSVQRVRADRWPGVEGVFDCCAICTIAWFRSARVNVRCFFVPGEGLGLRTAAPRFVRDGEPEIRRSAEERDAAHQARAPEPESWAHRSRRLACGAA